MKKTFVVLLVVAGVLLTACGGGAAPAPVASKVAEVATKLPEVAATKVSEVVGGGTLKIVSSLPLTGA